MRGDETFVSDDESANRECKPRTIADIIPSIQNAAPPTPLMFPVVKDDSYVLKSLASVGRNDRNRLDSNCSSRTRAREQALARLTAQSSGNAQHLHSRTNSDVSFAGFASFDQVRRNFKFSPNRAPFCLHANTNSKADVSSLSNDASYFSMDSSEVEVARRCEAVGSPFSMASVSLYGHVTRPGSRDPFDYGILVMPTFAPVRPPSMESTIDDTFDFVHGHSSQAAR